MQIALEPRLLELPERAIGRVPDPDGTGLLLRDFSLNAAALDRRRFITPAAPLAPLGYRHLLDEAGFEGPFGTEFAQIAVEEVEERGPVLTREHHGRDVVAVGL